MQAAIEAMYVAIGHMHFLVLLGWLTICLGASLWVCKLYLVSAAVVCNGIAYVLIQWMSRHAPPMDVTFLSMTSMITVVAFAILPVLWHDRFGQFAKTVVMTCAFLSSMMMLVVFSQLWRLVGSVSFIISAGFGMSVVALATACIAIYTCMQALKNS